MILISFKIVVFFNITSADLNPKREDSICKIDGFMATYTPKLKWVWQASFLSLTLLILKINTTFEDVQMMLKGYFDFSTDFRFSKISVECSVHICNCPWPIFKYMKLKSYDKKCRYL